MPVIQLVRRAFFPNQVRMRRKLEASEATLEALKSRCSVLEQESTELRKSLLNKEAESLFLLAEVPKILTTAIKKL